MSERKAKIRRTLHTLYHPDGLAKVCMWFGTPRDVPKFAIRFAHVVNAKHVFGDILVDPALQPPQGWIDESYEQQWLELHRQRGDLAPT